MDGCTYHNGKLAELLENLPGGQFVQCYRSIAVNIGRVQELGRSAAVLQNGETVPVSRNFVAAVLAAFLLWTKQDTGF